MPRTVLVTDATGFIGFHTALRLLRRGDRVVGLDNLNDYYDVALKEARLRLLVEPTGFSTVRTDLGDAEAVDATFRAHDVRSVIHLAAQVGVRGAVDAPRAYVDSNVVDFLNILESFRHCSTQRLVYASSSSVYGRNTAVPFSIHNGVEHPISLDAATGRSNDLMAPSYSQLFGLPTMGLRFFTVYGPWCRPDMAIFLFARAIVEGSPIDVFDNGDMARDFTFVDDVVKCLVRVLSRVPQVNKGWSSGTPDPATSAAPGTAATHRRSW